MKKLTTATVVSRKSTVVSQQSSGVKRPPCCEAGKSKITGRVILLSLLTAYCLLPTAYCFAQTAYIPNWGDNTLSVINITTNTVVDTIIVGSSPFGVSVSSDGSKVYITNQDDNTVSVINTATKTVSATISVGSYPTGVSVSPNGSKVYVANEVSHTVSVINSASKCCFGYNSSWY